ncbi:hypothetical protein O181_012065 [Austropuccinia psidii MF-1]|uniref:Uncharacterized protein n=1 Tax=Austropuccinia psidii MF-1 TaxID=1389203 RepID=A0A9Q3BX64_9BASI|nr:hypothetical protein [Austropuccinia psidii MF-1]
MNWMVNTSIGHHSSNSTFQPSFKILQIQVIVSNPRNFWLVFSTIPHPLTYPYTSREVLASPLRPSSPIPQLRKSPIFTSQQLKPVARSSKRREDKLTLPFPATQVFQRGENWPIWVTRKDPNITNEGQDAVARLFIRVYRNRREVISYTNY